MTTVLVTGAAGFTGHHMVATAAAQGFKVRATDVWSRHYGPLFDALGVEFVAADLTHRAGLEDVLDGVDAVFHVAGIHDYSTPDEVISAVNVGAVENVCDAAVAAGVGRLIHLSSVGVYGFGSGRRLPIAEDDEKLTPPLHNYNVTKWRGEQVVARFQVETELATTVLRPAAIYGTASEYGLYTVFERVWQARDKRRLLIVGKGDKIEAFVHAEDVARAAIFALENDTTVGDVYNVSDDSRLTTADFFRLVSRELLGEEKPLLHVPLRAILPVAHVAQKLAQLRGVKAPLEPGTLHYLNYDRDWDTSKLAATGFELKHPTAERGLADTLRWYREHGWFRG